MRNGLLRTLFLLLICQAANAAETLYVHDLLRLGVRPGPNSAEKSIATVTTGDALTVLAEEGDFIKVRTEHGIEGWVSKGYLSVEPPARNQLKSLQLAHESLQQQYTTLQQQSAALQQQLDEGAKQDQQVSGQLQQLQRDKAQLLQQLERYTGSAPGFYETYRWLMLLGGLLGCFIAGLLVGVRWKARQVAGRIGGLQI